MRKVTNAVKQALKYAESIPAAAEPFMNAKLEAAESYAREEIGEIPYGSTQKAFSHVTKQFVGDSRVLDQFDAEENPISQEAAALLRTVKLEKDERKTMIRVGTPLTADVYLYVARGNAIDIAGMTITPETAFTVQNFANAYGEEPFRFAVKSRDITFALKPEEAAGTKGVSVLALYVKENGRVIRLNAERYIEVENEAVRELQERISRPVYAEGKDCSEYAEEVIALLGEGRLITYHADAAPFDLVFFGQPQTFLYHTAVEVARDDGIYVIDVTAPEMIQKKERYQTAMLGLAADMQEYEGYKPVYG